MNATKQAPSRTETARDDLGEWLANQPTNFYTDDPILARTIARVGGPDVLANFSDALVAFGGVAATTLDSAAAINNRPWNLPRLERYNAIGERTEDVENHPTYHVAGKAIYESGMIAELGTNGGFLRALSLFYLSSQCGEAGHNCPVACTAGIVKTLQALGVPKEAPHLLDRLLSRNYDERYDGAQFLTELQGGSDVGANAVRAVDQGDGTWAIFGEKWFCSNANADLILMTARFDENVAGTPGLGLFLVERKLADGRANFYSLRRLKDKLGTRSMPSAEIDFNGAIARPMGEVTSGFRSMMRYVINTSRIYNAFATNGAARRAWHVARGYAHHRRAFGKPIVEFATTAKLVADLHAETTAAAIASFDLAALYDRAEANNLAKHDDDYIRVFVNANKLRSSRSATECVMWGIEVLGGNGAIESFSILPRLLRDMIVCENWEGTHNTLTAQALRDFRKLNVQAGFFAQLSGRLAAQPARGASAQLHAAIEATLGTMPRQLATTLAKPDQAATLGLRPLVEKMAFVAWALALLEQANADLDQGLETTIRLAEYWWNLRLSEYARIEFDELERIFELAR